MMPFLRTPQCDGEAEGCHGTRVLVGVPRLSTSCLCSSRGKHSINTRNAREDVRRHSQITAPKNANYQTISGEINKLEVHEQTLPLPRENSPKLEHSMVMSSSCGRVCGFGLASALV